MKFKIGDLVRFVDEPIEGHITSIQSEEMVGVTDETGFEIPVPLNKITLVFGNMRRDDDEIVDQAANIPHAGAKFKAQGVRLAITGDHKDGLAKLHIVNDTSYDLLVSVTDLNSGKAKGIFAEKISAFDSVQFYSANFAQVGKWPTFRFQMIKHYSLPQDSTHPIVIEQRIRPVDLTNPKELDEILNEKTWHYELDKPQADIGLEKLKNQFVSHRPNKR